MVGYNTSHLYLADLSIYVNHFIRFNLELKRLNLTTTMDKLWLSVSKGIGFPI